MLGSRILPNLVGSSSQDSAAQLGGFGQGTMPWETSSAAPSTPSSQQQLPWTRPVGAADAAPLLKPTSPRHFLPGRRPKGSSAAASASAAAAAASVGAGRIKYELVDPKSPPVLIRPDVVSIIKDCFLGMYALTSSYSLVVFYTVLSTVSVVSVEYAYLPTCMCVCLS